jgi:phosphoribosylformylglycinamidine (FGAM) synthase-like enzyme
LKDETEYYKHPVTADRLQRMCKECDKLRTKEAYLGNITEERRKRREWQEENHDLHLVHCQDYRSRKRTEHEKEVQE